MGPGVRLSGSCLGDRLTVPHRSMARPVAGLAPAAERPDDVP